MRRAFTLVEFVVVLVIILILAAILFPVFQRPHEGHGRRAACQFNLKQIGLGFLQYTQDAGEKSPPARVTSSTGWADVIQPYVKSTRIFQCPATQNGASPLSDYFYNRRIARVPLDKLVWSSQTILTGEGDDDAPTWASLSQLPTSWIKDENSPVWRHIGANYGFADGHVKWLKPSRIMPTFSQTDFAPTFAVR